MRGIGRTRTQLPHYTSASLTTRSTRSSIGNGLTSSHGTVSILLQLINSAFQQASWACAKGLFGVWVVEADEEEGYVVLPGYPPERGQVWYGEQVAVPVLLVRDGQFLEVGLVMHVPSEDDAAEAEAVVGYAEELLLGHELSTQHAVDIDARDFDRDVIFKQFGQLFGRQRGGIEFGGHGGECGMWKERMLLKLTTADKGVSYRGTSMAAQSGLGQISSLTARDGWSAIELRWANEGRSECGLRQMHPTTS